MSNKFDLIESFNRFTDSLIKKNRNDKNFLTKTKYLFYMWVGTSSVMWLYVLYCYNAFPPGNPVVIGGLLFTIIHTLAPVVFYVFQSQIPMSITLSLSGLGFQTLFCIYSGGVYSPAAIWLTLHPVILGFFGSNLLLVISVCLNFVIVVGLYLMGNLGYLPGDVLQINFKNYMIMSSYVGLDFLVAIFTIATIKTNNDKNLELSKGKELTENLLRIIAHDINNPLTILRHYGPIIQKDPDKFTPTIAERLNKSSEDIQKITESVTLWISHRDGKMALLIEPIDVEDLIRHIKLTFEDRLKNKKLELKLSLNHEQKKFMADKNAVFYQVFSNLISNAIKFSYENTAIEIKTYLHKDKLINLINNTMTKIANNDSTIFNATISQQAQLEPFIDSTPLILALTHTI